MYITTVLILKMWCVTCAFAGPTSVEDPVQLRMKDAGELLLNNLDQLSGQARFAILEST